MSFKIAAILLLVGFSACAGPPPPAPAIGVVAPQPAARTVLIAEGLAHPWDMMFLSPAEALVTEKDGLLQHVRLDTGKITSVSGFPADLDNLRRNDPRDNSGLFAIAPDPEFAGNKLLYITYSAGDETGTALKLVRARWGDDAGLQDVTEIFRIDPLSTDRFHYGGGLAFGSDGKLYLTAGERIFNETDQPALPVAQDVADMRGKIFRLNSDGTIPADNPDFGPHAVPGLYALGIRAAQGITLQPETGRLWFSEHGSIQGDEINVLSSGSNYGWPIVTSGTYRDTSYTPPQISSPFTSPAHIWEETVAPTGLTFYTGAQFPDWQGNILVAGLSRGSLWRLTVEGERVTGAHRLFEDAPVRLRNVRQGPDGALYLLTDEAQGRILQIDPAP